MQPVAIAHTPFKEKFAIPRQPSLAPAAIGCIELLPPYNQEQALVGLEQVSHVWLLFQFHAINADTQQQLSVRPPRLGGNQKIGVFASRSTHRPNGMGLSVVKVERIEGTKLYVSGLDLLDGTPILDIKPYVPYVDAVTEAHNQIAEHAPQTVQVQWQDGAKAQAYKHQLRLNQPVVELIEQILQQDPKPAYQQPEPERIYGVKLWDLNVQWHYPSATVIEVTEVM